jgi:hypothetical protein
MRCAPRPATERRPHPQPLHRLRLPQLRRLCPPQQCLQHPRLQHPRLQRSHLRHRSPARCRSFLQRHQARLRLLLPDHSSHAGRSANLIHHTNNDHLRTRSSR